ncbi:MAG: AcvB/VirJ family lysyl-phosphatidylglycerol hydrolase, partial [Halothiobacillaceae bacterium]
MMRRSRWAGLLIHPAKTWCFLALCVLAGGLADRVSAGESETMSSREWGPLALYWPATPTHDVVLMFSGAKGIEAQDALAAERVLRQGNAVALVDSSAILRWAKSDATACLELAAVGQWLSQTMQQRLGLDDFRPAVLVGRGLGGWVVHSLLAQAPEGVFQAGLSVDFVPGNPSAQPLCGVSTVAADRHIAPDTRLHGAWAVADTDALSFDAARFAHQAAQANGQREPWLQDGADYASLVGDFLQWVQSPSSNSKALAGLPVIEYLPKSDTHDAALENVRVLFFSGDGGWRDIDQQVGRALAEDGLHVLGIDALRYFWRKRSPEHVAADVVALLDAGAAGHDATKHPLKDSQEQRLVLIGYSFGANILPLVYAHL